jgi:hypothetical protein
MQENEHFGERNVLAWIFIEPRRGILKTAIDAIMLDLRIMYFLSSRSRAWRCSILAACCGLSKSNRRGLRPTRSSLFPTGDGLY